MWSAVVAVPVQRCPAIWQCPLSRAIAVRERSRQLAGLCWAWQELQRVLVVGMEQTMQGRFGIALFSVSAVASRTAMPVSGGVVVAIVCTARTGSLAVPASREHPGMSGDQDDHCRS